MDDIQFFNMDFWFQIIVMINRNIESSERQKMSDHIEEQRQSDNIHKASYIILAGETKQGKIQNTTKKTT